MINNTHQNEGSELLLHTQELRAQYQELPKANLPWRKYPTPVFRAEKTQVKKIYWFCFLYRPAINQTPSCYGMQENWPSLMDKSLGLSWIYLFLLPNMDLFPVKMPLLHHGPEEFGRRIHSVFHCRQSNYVFTKYEKLCHWKAHRAAPLVG